MNLLVSARKIKQNKQNQIRETMVAFKKSATDEEKIKLLKETIKNKIID